MRSTSSLPGVSLLEKARQTTTFLYWRLAWTDEAQRLDALLAELRELTAIYEKYAARPALEARIFEIGYGARPLRLLALHSMGFQVEGIDLDLPMVRWSLRRLLAILKTNGAERAAKTAIRNLLFDRREQRALATVLAKHGHTLRLDPRLLTGDALRFDFGGSGYDLIYSFDVFEHIPRADVAALTARMAGGLAPGGLAVIAPLIYTGIAGGHLPEWFPYTATLTTPKATRPWEHLRDAPRVADVYLNQLTRNDYRAIFSAHFEIVEELDRTPDLGRQWLTPETRRELAAWSDEDLFSNSIWFVLRSRRNP